MTTKMRETNPERASWKPSFEPFVPMQAEADCCDPNPLIEARGLGLSFRTAQGHEQAFEGVDLDLHEGCITALVGPSGCGKTSFLNCLNRMTDLIPGARIEGALRMGDIDLLDPRLDVIALRRRIGMVFQRPNPFPASIRKNLELGLREQGVRRRAELDRRIEAGLRDVGLWSEVRDRLGESALRLSGGQQQRLCLARALVLEPQLILMDEPCSALDPIASGVVEELIESLRGRVSVLIVTHNLAQARRIADWGALFWRHEGPGRLVEFGAIQQIFDQPEQEVTAAYVKGRRG